MEGGIEAELRTWLLRLPPERRNAALTLVDCGIADSVLEMYTLQQQKGPLFFKHAEVGCRPLLLGVRLVLVCLKCSSSEMRCFDCFGVTIHRSVHVGCTCC